MIRRITQGGDKWKWHNRQSVWDKIATDLAGDDDWISKKNNKKTVVDKDICAGRSETVYCPQENQKKMKGKTSRPNTAKEIGAR